MTVSGRSRIALVADNRICSMLVDRGILLDVGVRRRHVGFRLVVIVIGNEILHRVVGKNAFISPYSCAARSCWRQHQRRTLHGGDDVGDGEGLAAAGDAEQGLMRQAVVQARDQRADGVRLIAGGLESGAKGKGLFVCMGNWLAGIFSMIRQSELFPVFNFSVRIQESS